MNFFGEDGLTAWSKKLPLLKTAGNLRVIAIYTDYSLIEIVAGLSYSIDGHF